MTTKDTHCSHCGTRFEGDDTYPKSCKSCGQTTWANPTPVAVALVPHDGGIICVRRGIEPGYGKLALPGGVIERAETWKDGAIREMLEETGARLDPKSVRVFVTETFQPLFSTPGGNLLIFAEAELADSSPVFVTDRETLEVVVVREPVELAFPAHTEALRAWFARRASRMQGTRNAWL